MKTDHDTTRSTPASRSSAINGWVGIALVVTVVLGSLVMAQEKETISPTDRMYDAWQQQFVGPKLTARYNELMAIATTKATLNVDRPVDDQHAVAAARKLEINKLEVEIQLLQFQYEYLDSQETKPETTIQEAFQARISSLELLKKELSERESTSITEVER